MAVIEARTVMLRDGVAVTVRSPVEADVAGLLVHIRDVLLTSEFAATQPDEWEMTEEKLREWIRERAEGSGSVAIVAEVEGEGIVGAIHLKNHPRRRMAHHGHFGLGVSQTWRGRGIGRVLTAAVLEWAEANPLIEKVCLGVFEKNVPARRLYEALGFKIEGRRLCEFRTEAGEYSHDIQMFQFVKPHLRRLNVDQPIAETIGVPLTGAAQ